MVIDSNRWFLLWKRLPESLSNGRLGKRFSNPTSASRRQSTTLEILAHSPGLAVMCELLHSGSPPFVVQHLAAPFPRYANFHWRSRPPSTSHWVHYGCIWIREHFCADFFSWSACQKIWRKECICHCYDGVDTDFCNATLDEHVCEEVWMG